MICRLECLSLPLVRRLARVANAEGGEAQALVRDAVRALLASYGAHADADPPAFEVVWHGGMRVSPAEALERQAAGASSSSCPEAGVRRKERA